MNRKSVDGRTIEFEATWDGDMLTAIDADGQSHGVAVASSGPGRHQVIVNGISNSVFTASEPSGGVWVWSKGRARLVHDVEGRTRSGHTPGGEDSQGLVTPPMPAVVTEILVEIGQVVDKGCELVVLSAMKMETRLVAGHAGTVSAINTEVGSNVMPGEVLLEVEPLEVESDG